jgi:hypothetical protein
MKSLLTARTRLAIDTPPQRSLQNQQPQELLGPALRSAWIYFADFMRCAEADRFTIDLFDPDFHCPFSIFDPMPQP